MKPKHTEVGWKKNVDKLLFILASVYLISAIAWFWKNQRQASAARNNNNSVEVVKTRETFESSQAESNASSSSLMIDSENKPSSTLADQILPSTSTVRIEEETQPNQISNLNSHQRETEEVISFSGRDTQPTLSIPPAPLSLPPISTPPPPPPISQPIQSSSPLSIKTPPRPQPSLRRVQNPPTKLNRVPVIKSLSQEEISIANQPVDSSSSYPLAGNENSLRNTLLGVVELEHNSVALFNLNNLTEKVEVGSEVGTTGWLLVGISGKQAILNRDNQSRYLTVGEQF